MPVTRSARRPEASSSKDTLDKGDDASPETAESNRHEDEDDIEIGSTLQVRSMYYDILRVDRWSESAFLPRHY